MCGCVAVVMWCDVAVLTGRRLRMWRRSRSTARPTGRLSGGHRLQREMMRVGVKGRVRGVGEMGVGYKYVRCDCAVQGE